MIFIPITFSSNFDDLWSRIRVMFHFIVILAKNLVFCFVVIIIFINFTRIFLVSHILKVQLCKVPFLKANILAFFRI